MGVSELFPDAIGWGDVVLATLTLVAGWIVSRLVRRGVLAIAARAPGLSENVVDVAARVATYTVLLLTFGFALALLGADVQPLLAVVVIIGVVLVLVVRGISDNFTSGVVIQARQTVRIGDEIQVAGPSGPLTGTVAELNARSVVVNAADGRVIHVPNARLLADVLINQTSGGALRSEVTVRAERNDRRRGDLLHLLESTTAKIEAVRPEPPPIAIVESILPTTDVIRLQYWHGPGIRATTSSTIVTAIAVALAGAGWVGTVASGPLAQSLRSQRDGPPAP